MIILMTQKNISVGVAAVLTKLSRKQSTIC